jgi:hypothetical protein
MLKFLKINENGNTTFLSLWETAQAGLTGKHISIKCPYQKVE